MASSEVKWLVEYKGVKLKIDATTPNKAKYAAWRRISYATNDKDYAAYRANSRVSRVYPSNLFDGLK